MGPALAGTEPRDFTEPGFVGRGTYLRMPGDDTEPRHRSTTTTTAPGEAGGTTTTVVDPTPTTVAPPEQEPPVAESPENGQTVGGA
jgi:hypothetical protein